jgi:hypothetical protein
MEVDHPIHIPTAFVVAHFAVTSAAFLLLQLRLKIREIKVLSVRLNFSIRVDLKDADAVHEEHISSLGLKT